MDMNNDYTFAGKGAKARLRLQQVNAKTMQVKKTKAKPYLQRPEAEKRKVRRERMSDSYQSAQGVKARIRYLVIDHDMGYLDCVQTMKEQGYAVSGVTISAIRTEIREVMKLLENEGLLNLDALAKRRRKIKARDD